MKIAKDSTIIFADTLEKYAKIIRRTERCFDLSYIRMFIVNKLAIVGGETIASMDFDTDDIPEADRQNPCYRIIAMVLPFVYCFAKKIEGEEK